MLVNNQEKFYTEQFFSSQDEVNFFIDKMEKFFNEVIDFNQNYNIIGLSTISNFYTRHILDSLQLTKYIDQDSANHKDCPQIIDFGSGAGIPALILSVYYELIKKKQKNIYLIEKSTVKSIFLNKMISKLKLNNSSVLNKPHNEIDFSFVKKKAIITSRAFKSILETSNIIRGNKFLLENIHQVIFLKGEKLDQEMKELLEDSNFINFYSHIEKNISITNVGCVISFYR